MTTRSTTNSVFDPKFAADQVGIAASLGQLSTAPTVSRPAAIDDDVLAKSPPPHVADDFRLKEPPVQDHADTVIPLPDPQFGIDDGLFPIYGTGGDDDIDGTAEGDTIYAEGGNDEVHGLEGHDKIEGNDGHDFLTGDEGNDFILGGDGDDFLDGDTAKEAAGDGNDFLNGGSGDDTLYGRGGDDWLFGGSGNDDLIGGSGDDTLIGDAGRDSMFGGTGADAFLSFDDIQQHDVWDYWAADGDTVDGVSWEYIEEANWTAVYSEGGAAVFLLRGYNAEISGINLVQYAPEPAA